MGPPLICPYSIDFYEEVKTLFAPVLIFLQPVLHFHSLTAPQARAPRSPEPRSHVTSKMTSAVVPPGILG